MNESKLTVFGAIGLALCCGLPALLATGALAAVGGALVRLWPLTLLGGGVFAYGTFKVLARVRRLSIGNEHRDDMRRLP